ncbi:hypothetical protein PSECIP111951_00269 [Pseudoalteromonas holothuriae]|uniref:N-acetyltransferase domain-containing protein n=1 Tax=Pseudoalteromonas holothuriae TaxID=2963714 RepID=A0A9W4VT96_9GAMM|nr:MULTISPECIES: GNAT family N-acetyltransferase [unclassified Pseudoalteromonas]CAH9050806.1 hypothetical protein PSECIP111951_00269 [Pseudoalteromonas sp. CIP111951]CAH9061467.1 hypothetical protein PSECIP111854_02817 [Pseudoalteromonas sp. CIP111854]
MSILHTKRLVVRKATMEDVDFILALLNQRSFIDNIADKQIHTLKDAQNYIQGAFLDAYELGDKAPYIVTLQEGTAIGVAGFYQRPIFDLPDLGYAFIDQYTGYGYAKEACMALLKFAKYNLNIDAILAITSAKNQPSIKLLLGLGLEFQSKVVLDKSMEESNLYRLDF